LKRFFVGHEVAESSHQDGDEDPEPKG
jgi:hypothetical protein